MTFKDPYGILEIVADQELKLNTTSQTAGGQTKKKNLLIELLYWIFRIKPRERKIASKENQFQSIGIQYNRHDFLYKKLWHLEVQNKSRRWT